MNGLLLEAPADAGRAATVLLLRPAAAPDAPPLLRLTLRPAIGRPVPRFWFHVGCTVHASPSLGLFHHQRTLQLGNDHTGASELAIEVLGTSGGAADTAAALRLAVQGAQLLLAERRPQFAPRVIVELPGLREGDGSNPALSPFWQGFVRHFHADDPAHARQRLGEDWRAGVAALLPRHLVYTAFLPPAAQAAIAQVAAAALPLREALEEAGFRYSHHVCVDDAGPVLEAETDALPGVAAGRRLLLAAAPAGASFTPHWVLAEAAGRACVARLPACVAEGRVLLPHEALQALGAQPGQWLRVRPAQGG